MFVQCHKCNCPYDSNNSSSCPACWGLGLPDKKCTCTHYATLAGSLNVIAKKDPNCPIHGSGAIAEQKASPKQEPSDSSRANLGIKSNFD